MPSGTPSRHVANTNSTARLGYLSAINLFLLTLISLGLATQLAKSIRDNELDASARHRLRTDFDSINTRPFNRPGPAITLTEPELQTRASKGQGASEKASQKTNSHLDPWGTPLLRFDGPVVGLGVSPDDGPWLVSAGPDGRFLTITDNIYSYDLDLEVTSRSFIGSSRSLPTTRLTTGQAEP